MGRLTDRLFRGIYGRIDSQNAFIDEYLHNIKLELEHKSLEIDQSINLLKEELGNVCLKTDQSINELKEELGNVVKQFIELEQSEQLNKKELSEALLDLKQRTESRIEDLVASYERDIVIGGSRYNWNSHKLEQINNEIISLYNKPDKKNLRDEQLIKNIIRNKWKLIDKFEEKCHLEGELECPVCHHKFKENESDILESECVFLGGKLRRFLCPNCNGIFGPNKMLLLDDHEFSDEYTTHYSVFSEGDSTEAEIRTFFRLNPEKGKKYLNYGSGAWSKTISTLRDQGFDLIGFDPYAPVKSEHIINSWEELSLHKFDGIFSHDLLEHLRNPVEEFNKMKTILSDEGIMVHSTACFNYVYEYTRFHLFFYTGTSVNEICNQTGLRVIAKDECNEEMIVDYTFAHNNTNI